MRWPTWTTLGLGLWLIVAPSTFGYTGLTAAVLNDGVLAAVIIGLSAWDLAAEGRAAATFQWMTASAGLWLIVAPFQFGYLGAKMMYIGQDHMPLPYLAGYGPAAAAGTNDVIVGLAVLVLSLTRARARSQRVSE